MSTRFSLVVPFFATLMAVSRWLPAGQNLRLNPRLDYSSDSPGRSADHRRTHGARRCAGHSDQLVR